MLHVAKWLATIVCLGAIYATQYAASFGGGKNGTKSAGSKAKSRPANGDGCSAPSGYYDSYWRRFSIDCDDEPIHIFDDSDDAECFVKTIADVECDASNDFIMEVFSVTKSKMSLRFGFKLKLPVGSLSVAVAASHSIFDSNRLRIQLKVGFKLGSISVTIRQSVFE